MKSSILITLIFVLVGSVVHAQVAHFIASTSKSNDTLSFEMTGGSFKSYGCKPIDPTYWMSGNTGSVTITFAKPETNPSFRVWGMNTDDMASVIVNGESFPLTSATAYYSQKVVCGTSPGPNGVLFVDGNLVGANTPGEANFSYQDIQLNATNVTSITITPVKGAGWGFVGVVLNWKPSTIVTDTKSTAASTDTKSVAPHADTKQGEGSSDTKPQTERETQRPKP